MNEEQPQDEHMEEADMLSTADLIRALAKRTSAMVISYRSLLEDDANTGYGSSLVLSGDTLLCLGLTRMATLDIEQILQGLQVQWAGNAEGDPEEDDDAGTDEDE